MYINDELAYFLTEKAMRVENEKRDIVEITSRYIKKILLHMYMFRAKLLLELKLLNYLISLLKNILCLFKLIY